MDLKDLDKVEEIEDTIDFYYGLFRKIYEKVSDVFCDASNVALEIFKEVVRDLRENQSLGKAVENAEEDLATKRQREAIHKFGVKHIPEDLSKEEASEILEKLITFSKENDSTAIAETVDELNQKWSKENFQKVKK